MIQKSKIHLIGNRLFNFTLIGPPGSGKGTYGSIVLKEFLHKVKDNSTDKSTLASSSSSTALFVSTGDVLRDNVKNRTSIGKIFEDYQKKGILVKDDRLVKDAILQYLDTHLALTMNGDSQIGFILDGFPRTIQQTRFFSPSKNEWPPQYNINCAILIDVPYFICESKMLGRRFCPICKSNFNVCDISTKGFHMPAILPKNCECTLKNNQWEKRIDDTPEIIEKRHKEYLKETEPVLDYYEKQGKLLRFIPYNGVKDVHKLKSLMESFMTRNNNTSIK